MCVFVCHFNCGNVNECMFSISVVMFYHFVYLYGICFLHCSPHPYLFFNEDGNSFTFMGFIINVQTGDILDPHTGETLTPQALPRQLYEALIRNRVNLRENFDELPRQEPFPMLLFLLMAIKYIVGGSVHNV